MKLTMEEVIGDIVEMASQGKKEMEIASELGKAKKPLFVTESWVKMIMSTDAFRAKMNAFQKGEEGGRTS